MSSRIETRKVIESLREDTFLKKSLPIVALVIILESEPMPFFSLFLKEDKATALEGIFLEAEEAKTILEEYFAM